jgi:hypothetical protein
MILGAGTLTVGGASVGATMEGNSFTVKQTKYEPKFDGVKGKGAKGAVWVLEEEVILEITLAEATFANLQAALPGATVASDASSQVMTYTGSRIATSEFKDVVLTVTKDGGLTLVITLKDALQSGDLALKFGDDKETGIKVTFKAYHDPATATASCYTIRNNIA